MTALAFLALAATQVTLSAANEAPVLGVDQETDLHVRIDDDRDSDHISAPRLIASAGRFEDLQRVGPRLFTARYLLPPGRFPQAAILVAEVASPGAGAPARAVLVLRLRAAASPRFETEPGARVTLRVGNKEFGPQVAGRDGIVRIPIVVPPGVGFGVARSVNHYGQATESTVDLKIPPFRRVLLVAPETMPAGATVEVAAYAVDGSGAPVAPPAIQLRSSGPRPQPLGGRAGEARFLVRAPARLTPPALTLEVQLRDEPTTAAAAEVALVPDRPARLAIRPDRPRLPIGAGSSMRVYLAAEDRFGNRTDAGSATVLVDGAPVETRTTEDGQVMAIVPAPPRFAGRDHVAVEAALGGSYAAERIPLSNLPPRVAPPPPDPRDLVPALTVTPRLGVVWNLRAPPGPALVLEALARRPSWPGALSAGMALGLLSTGFDAANGLGLSRVTVRQLPAMVLARLQHRPAPRLVAAIGAGGGVSWASTRVRSFGRTVPGHDLAPVALLDCELAVAAGAGQQIVLGARYLYVRLGDVSSGDRVLGNSAGLVADVGYRRAW